MLRPISKAPRDGTRIIVFAMNGDQIEWASATHFDVRKGRWSGEPKDPAPASHWMPAEVLEKSLNRQIWAVKGQRVTLDLDSGKSVSFVAEEDMTLWEVMRKASSLKD